MDVSCGKKEWSEKRAWREWLSWWERDWRREGNDWRKDDWKDDNVGWIEEKEERASRRENDWIRA